MFASAVLVGCVDCDCWDADGLGTMLGLDACVSVTRVGIWDTILVLTADSKR